MERDEPTRESLFGESVTIDDLDDKAPDDKPKGGDALADGDDIPDEYKGKSVNEIIKIANAARDGVRSATSAAEAARAAADVAAQSYRQPAPVADEPKDLTRDELQALYDEDPVKMIEAVESQAARRIDRHIEQRLAPLTAGTMSAAENWAKEEFPEEFELFGDDLKKLVDSVPNKAVFTSKDGWQDAIAYVRGRKGNFEKLVKHRQDKEEATSRDASRGRERDTAGFGGRSNSGTRAPAADKAVADKMSPEMRTVAQSFIDQGVFKDYSEYQTWYNKGG